MAIRDNILTSEVRTNGYGGVDIGRFKQADRPNWTGIQIQDNTKRGGYL
jgi:hypothetical protein